jgi:hypothetical protein
VPAWADSAKILVNGIAQPNPKAGEFYEIKRTWKPGDIVTLQLPMSVRVSRWFHNSVAIERGPLVYSLRIGQSWREEKHMGPGKDWEIFPTTPWNYALLLDLRNPAPGFKVLESALTNQPFSFAAPPVKLLTQGRRVPEWRIEADSAGPVPESPLSCPKSPCSQAPETIELIPYGAAKLRVTAFPYFTK